MRIFILTLFPEMFTGPFDESIVKRAVEKHAVDITLINLREFATDAYKSVDDHPYGGGIGMILRVDIVSRAIDAVKKTIGEGKTRTILLDAQGKPYKQNAARRLSTYDHLILIAGHYEGFDERIRTLVDEEISVGDYILTGGEIPAMVLTDSIVRLLPGVLEKPQATIEESFTAHSLEYPHYTRPQSFRSQYVPPILLSGNHAAIAEWRDKQAKIRTKKRRPDLIRARKDPASSAR